MRVNGENIQIINNQKLSEFLLEKGYEITRIAVEYNGNVIPRKSFADIIIKDTDSLEIVCFVGGG